MSKPKQYFNCAIQVGDVYELQEQVLVSDSIYAPIAALTPGLTAGFGRKIWQFKGCYALEQNAKGLWALKLMSKYGVKDPVDYIFKDLDFDEALLEIFSRLEDRSTGKSLRFIGRIG